MNDKNADFDRGEASGFQVGQDSQNPKTRFSVILKGPLSERAFGFFSMVGAEQWVENERHVGGEIKPWETVELYDDSGCLTKTL